MEISKCEDGENSFIKHLKPCHSRVVVRMLGGKAQEGEEARSSACGTGKSQARKLVSAIWAGVFCAQVRRLPGLFFLKIEDGQMRAQQVRIQQVDFLMGLSIMSQERWMFMISFPHIQILGSLSEWLW